MPKFNFRITEKDVSQFGRIDIYLANNIQTVSREKIQQSIKSGYLSINGKKIAKCGYSPAVDDKIEFTIIEKLQPAIKPENIPIDIIFEDDDYIAINKDIGIITHPTATNSGGSLVNALLYSGDIADNGYEPDGYEYRPGVVHRLDKDTSGLILFAKNATAQSKLSELFKTRQIEKLYIALVYGYLRENSGLITYPLGRSRNNRKIMSVTAAGKPAITEFKVIGRKNNYTLLELNLKTGRTHQIRAHLKAIRHPVVGDNLSGNSEQQIRLMLHSYSVGFLHPLNKTVIKLIAPLKTEFAEFLNRNGFDISEYKIENQPAN